MEVVSTVVGAEGVGPEAGVPAEGRLRVRADGARQQRRWRAPQQDRHPRRSMGMARPHAHRPGPQSQGGAE